MSPSPIPASPPVPTTRAAARNAAAAATPPRVTGDASPPRAVVRLADTVLALAAVLGAVCIVLSIATVVFDVRVTLFSTGSMSPTIPAGSAAVARGIPAADIRVGDVVTVERTGKLPITHRVTGVETVPDGSAGMRRITMRGDANAVEDPAPYDVERVRVVLFSVPGIAPAIAAAGTPPVMAAVTVATTALVVAVFWPRRTRDDARRRRRAGP
ncbi:signal peptidase I [Microbacterium sp. cf332]|uniref:signal peptidase I n=1 Tax=Microbacterium sp. cf332 TaxID=1761804 RepID=UPI00088E4FAD|nr:signal peptidase I [Microbacterium sp. cf332]SDQ63991.1 signal peptidase, endoplasmic reticulum-type [Microbacterium sp. cf332]